MSREEALDTALGQIERQFGKGSVMRMSDRPQVAVGAVSTGSLALDLALGIGGLPRGRIVEIYGPEASGKTTLVYHVMAEAQRRGGICAFIDAEHAMDPSYARRIGVDIDQLLVSQPDTGEQALEITELLIRSGALDIVAIDSVAALVPKAEIEGEMGDSHVGLQARLMSQALRKLAGTLNRTDTICIFTNQLREKIGVMFGNPETTPGGRALKFYASVRLDIRRIETLKDGAEAIGNRVRVKVAKNKVAPPFKQAEFDIVYGPGIPWEGTVLDVALEKKIVQKAGSYFSFGDERLGQGRQNASAFLAENPDLVQQILARDPGGGAGGAGHLRAAPADAAGRGRASRRAGRQRRRRPRCRGSGGSVRGGRGRDVGLSWRGPETPGAVEAALRALRHRDLSAAELDRRLAARRGTTRRSARRRSRRSSGPGSSTTAASRSRGPRRSPRAERATRSSATSSTRAGMDEDLVADAIALLEPESDRARSGSSERRGLRAEDGSLPGREGVLARTSLGGARCNGTRRRVRMTALHPTFSLLVALFRTGVLEPMTATPSSRSSETGTCPRPRRVRPALEHCPWPRRRPGRSTGSGRGRARPSGGVSTAVIPR